MVPTYPVCVVLQIKYNQVKYKVWVLIIYASWKFLRLGNSPWGFLWLIFGPGIFFGSVGSPRVFWGFWFLSRLDHPCHLKSRVPPGVISFLFVYIFQFTKICEFTNYYRWLPKNYEQSWSIMGCFYLSIYQNLWIEIIADQTIMNYSASIMWKKSHKM